jgi:hypothetical protein
MCQLAVFVQTQLTVRTVTNSTRTVIAVRNTKLTCPEHFLLLRKQKRVAFSRIYVKM